MSASTEQLIDIVGLAERVGVSVRLVRRLVNERRIPFFKIGRHIRFEPDEVERWIRTSRVEARQSTPPGSLTTTRPLARTGEVG